jgi:hypothetical protein
MGDVLTPDFNPGITRCYKVRTAGTTDLFTPDFNLRQGFRRVGTLPLYKVFVYR